jgi:tetratricopeptide (TPR) repeat protein
MYYKDKNHNTNLMTKTPKILPFPGSGQEKYLNYLDILEKLNIDLVNANTKEEKGKTNFQIGLIYYLMGKYIMTKDYLENGIKYKPRFAYYILGLSHFKKGQLIEKSGNFYAAKFNYDRSIFYFKKALCQHSQEISDFEIKLALGKVFNELNDYYQLSSLLQEMVYNDCEQVAHQIYKDFEADKTLLKKELSDII